MITIKPSDDWAWNQMGRLSEALDGIRSAVHVDSDPYPLLLERRDIAQALLEPLRRALYEQNYVDGPGVVIGRPNDVMALLIFLDRIALDINSLSRFDTFEQRRKMVVDVLRAFANATEVMARVDWHPLPPVAHSAA